MSLLALALLTGCGTSGASAGQAGGRVAPTAVSVGDSPMPDSATMIHIRSFRYTVPATVAPGATVSVMNMDGESHTVTADSGNAFDIQVAAGSTATFTAPKSPGSYPFHCTYHSDMHGVLVVK